jgi:hypothetical protein
MRVHYALGLALAAALGCGGQGPGTATVAGRVTLPDGSPLPGGRIDFRGESGDMVSGQIGADGNYEVARVPRGAARVSVENVQLRGLGPPPPGLMPMPGASTTAGQKYVPINARYRRGETSGLTTTVNGDRQTFDIRLR